MTTNDQLLSLIGDIYDSALDQSLWPKTLGAIAAYTDTSCVGLATQRTTGEIVQYSQIGVDPRYIKSYSEDWVKADTMPAIQFRDIGDMCSSSDVRVDDLGPGEMYHQWVRPQGYLGAANVLVAKSAADFSYFGVMRGAVVDAELRGRLARITPHMRRALLISNAMERQETRSQNFVNALDRLSAGVFLLGSSGQLVHANGNGKQILDRHDFVRSIRGRLIVNDAQHNRILRRAAAEAIRGDGAAGNGSIALPLTARDGTRFVCHVLTLTSGARRQVGDAHEATVALFVRRATLDAMPAPQILKDVFKLTPAELRVLLAVVEVGGVPEVARKLAVAESTIKTHLGKVFTKTDTKRQADLVKLVAAFSPPAGR